MFGAALEGLVGDRRDSLFEATARQRLVGRKVEVGEDILPLAHQRDLGRLRLLDLDDEFRFAPDFLGGLDDFCPYREVVIVFETRSLAGGRLHEHRVPVAHEKFSTHGQQTDAVFVGFHLTQYADFHLALLRN